VAAGEEVAVQVTFRNPLAIKLSLSHVRLQVQFTPAGAGSAGSATAAAAADGSAADGSAAAVAAAPRQDEVVVVESQFSLHPGWLQLLSFVCVGFCCCCYPGAMCSRQLLGAFNSSAYYDCHVGRFWTSVSCCWFCDCHDADVCLR
jgi:hypothetical protein